MSHDKLDDLLLQYRNMFDENFRVMAMKGTNEEDLRILVKDCIDNQSPYVLDYDTGTDY